MLDKNKATLYLDLYGSLLTDKQRRDVELYLEEDYSLSEISEIVGATRQAVHDSINRAMQKLMDLEEKLGLYKRLGEQEIKLKEIKHLMLQLEGNDALRSEILSIISQMIYED